MELDGTEDSFEDQHSLQRSTILRIYNYYRILIAFLILFLFLNEDFAEFVGAINPDLFITTIFVYLFGNILVGLSPLIVPEELISKPAPSFIILVADVIGLTLLISTSGGVASGLGLFLIFTVTFAGGLIRGPVSTVVPAIAFILTIYSEFYLFFLGLNELRSFFQAGILGIVFFAANIFFQKVSQLLHKRESEVFMLEEINRIIVDQMRSGVAVVSKQGEIKLINAAGSKLLYPNLGDSEVPEQLPRGLMEKINEYPHDDHQETITFNTDDDSPDLLASFSHLNAPGNEVDRLIFIDDSTEVQRRAQQLKLAALGRLSASIAHEIRNPLGAISHAAQLLSESEDLSVGDRRLSDIVQNHCVRMNRVIENVLQMSRRKMADPRPLVIGKWIRDFIDEFSAGFPDGVRIEIETENLPDRATMDFDPLHLSQVLGNLCQNGLRYSEKFSREAKLILRIGIDPKGQNYIQVIDFGQGVDEDLVPNLFEPFYTTESTGTGLGLYLSNELCEANNARLSYSRASTGGSCFRISIIQQVRR